MPAPYPPGPPKVHAPHRLTADAAPAGSGGPAGLQTVDAAAVGQSPAAPGVGQGAAVTASVPGAGAPAAPGQPTTSTAGKPPFTPGGLARTGTDVALLLGFALAAILLGVLLVRLGKPRPLTHQPFQGAS